MFFKYINLVSKLPPFRSPGLKNRTVRHVRTGMRGGFTLVEIAMAMAVAAIMLVSVSTFVADALDMQIEADRLSVAITLARTKMTQLTTGQDLEVTDEQGEFGDDAGIYRGYTYEISIREEQIDLAKVQQSGTISSSPVADELPPPVQNESDEEKEMGSSETTATGGLVDVYNVIVKIGYPRGGGSRGEYIVQTYQPNNKKP